MDKTDLVLAPTQLRGALLEVSTFECHSVTVDVVLCVLELPAHTAN